MKEKIASSAGPMCFIPNACNFPAVLVLRLRALTTS
jgi:hypothetical protein